MKDVENKVKSIINLQLKIGEPSVNSTSLSRF
jgi:hypothetical protein